MEITLLLVRHAQADVPGAAYPDDSRRPLVAKGVEQAQLLALAFGRMRLKLDRIYASPFVRAAQTAEPLAALLRRGRAVAYLDSLADNDYLRVIADLHDRHQEGDGTVALVGHEPYLGELGSLLLTGDRSGMSIVFRKSAVLMLTGPVRAGGMGLETMLPMRIAKGLMGTR